MSRKVPITVDPPEILSNAEGRIARNTLILVSLRVILPLFGFVLVLILSRYLGVDALGRYTLGFSYLYVFSSLGPLGLYSVITREGSKDQANLQRVLGNSLTLGSLASIPLTIAMAGLAYILDYDQATRNSILILSLAIFPSTIKTFLDGSLVALERMDYILISTVVEYSIKVGLGIFLLYLSNSLEFVISMAVLGSLIGCLISIQLLKGVGIIVRWIWQKDAIKDLLGLAPTFLLISIFATLYWRVDTFMLAQLRPVEDVGYYGGAFRVLELVMVVPQSFCLSLFPHISYAAANDLYALGAIGRNAMRYLMGISLPVSIGGILLSGPILELLYGSSFLVASSTLSILMLSIIPYSIVRYHAYVLVGANHQQADLWLNVILSLINVMLNLIWIPNYGYLGAALATFISICAYAILQFLYLKFYLPGHGASLKIPFVIIVGCAAMTLILLLIRDGNVIISIMLGCMTYFAIILMGGFFTKSELKLLKIDRLPFTKIKV